VIFTLMSLGRLSRLAPFAEMNALDCVVICRLTILDLRPLYRGFSPRQTVRDTLPQEIRFTDLIANDGIHQRNARQARGRSRRSAV